MDKPAARLAVAIESGDFDRAQCLVVEYGNIVRDQLRAASTSTERENILEQVLRTFQRNLYLARAIRSHLSASLQIIAGQSLYQQPAPQRCTWRIEA